MYPPAVSVIIPTYGGAEHLGQAIQSVLDQTFTDFELLVVNDASPDDTDAVLNRFQDPRIRYLKHENNRGVANARKTGVLASAGAIIAHLDQDDLYHPDKLRIHVDYLKQHPEIGFTYNSRFELYPSSGAIREILRPSAELTLADFVLSFPLAPSVWVQRREWAVLDEIWEEKTFYRGREIVICGRLYMAGCKFAMIDRVLNYRRYHKRRIVKNVARQCEAERICQQIILRDPRCPPEVRTLGDFAASNIYSMWAYVAYLQAEVDLGRELLAEAVRLNPELLNGKPPALVNDLILDSIDDEGASHEAVLAAMFKHLPDAHSALGDYLPWAISRGYLLQGIRAILWEREAQAFEYFSQVRILAFQFDETLLQWVTSHLLAYESEFGVVKTRSALLRICQRLSGLGGGHIERRLKGYFFANSAFERYAQKRFAETCSNAFRAFWNAPAYLFNRGLISALFHSLFGLIVVREAA